MKTNTLFIALAIAHDGDVPLPIKPVNKRRMMCITLRLHLKVNM